MPSEERLLGVGQLWFSTGLLIMLADAFLEQRIGPAGIAVGVGVCNAHMTAGLFRTI